MQSTTFGRSRSVIVAIALAVAALFYASAQGSGIGEASPSLAGDANEAEAAILRANLGGRIEAALDDDFGGVWFERSTGQLHVGVTSPADRRLAEEVAERAGLSEVVTETRVDSTWAELEAAQGRLNDHLADLLARGEVTTSAAPDLNSVTVELGSAVSDQRRAALERAASATGVDVSISVASRPRLVAAAEARCKKFVTGAAHCDKPIVAGVTIQSETNQVCTAGPATLLQDLSTAEKSTATYILTAGHCGAKGEKWYAYPKAGGEKRLIGESVEVIHSLAAKFDVQVIKVNNPGEWVNEGEIPVIPGIAPWNAAAEVEPFAVTTQLPKPMKGAKVCVSGQTSGTSCGGLVEEPSVTKTFETGTSVEKLVEVKGTATGGGTSGGPWFSEATPGQVYGTHVGAEVGGNQRKFFQLLEVSFGVLATKLKLLTTANEKRKHP